MFHLFHTEGGTPALWAGCSYVLPGGRGGPLRLLQLRAGGATVPWVPGPDPPLWASGPSSEHRGVYTGELQRSFPGLYDLLRL